MRTTRKLLALLLAVAMVFTMTAMTALATGGDDGTTTPDNGTTMPGGDPTPDGTPTTPDGGAPTTPNGGTPTTPDGGDLTTPDGGTPTTPDGGTPTTPNGGTPTTPDGGPTTPEVSADAQTVINLIAALPTSEEIQVAMTAGTFDVEAFKAKVFAARAAYNVLSDTDKTSVGDISRLNQAEETLAQLESISLLGTETVCEIEGGNQYQTLQDAVAAVQPGGTITLTKNFEIDSRVDLTIDKNIILDLNGCTVTKTYGGINHYFMVIHSGGSLTIKDSKGEGALIANDPLYGYGIQLKGDSPSLIMEGGKIQTTQESIDLYDFVQNATVSINGGDVISTSDSVLNVRGKSNIDVNITGGTLTSGGRTGVYISSYTTPSPIHFNMTGGTLNFTGGASGAIQAYNGAIVTIGGDATITSTSSYAIQAQENVKLIIEGGDITSSSTHTITAGEYAEVKITGGTVGNTANRSSTATIHLENNSQLSVTGGTLTSKNGSNIKREGSSTVTITGGTFSSNVEEYVEGGKTVEQDDNGNYVVGDAAAVAKIGETTYSSLAEALKDAESGETVTLLKNITVNEWNQAWNLKGITLDGDGNTIKVNAIASLQNHDAVFHSAGGNTFKNLTVDLSDITQASHAQGNRAFAAMAGDTFRNVTIKGSDAVSYGITISGTDDPDETVTIDGCTIKNCAYAIYDSETGAVENLIIKKSTITGCDYATILHSPHGQFINNKVTGGRLNIMEEDQTITGNTFDGKSRIKFYNAPKEFKQNKILEDSHLDKDGKLTDTIDVSENYWGGGKPTKDQLGNIDSVTGTDVYYVKDTMWPQDLNTYTPPSGGSGGSGSYLPVILSPVWNQTVSVIEHGTLTMSVRASRASSYQWFVDRGDGRGFVAIAGATGPSLTIWPDMGDNGNRYYCRAKNSYDGVNSPYFTLCVVRSTLPPKTGDQVCVTLWVCLMALGVAGALTAWNRQKNR